MRTCILILQTRTKVEETGGANFIFVTKDGKVVTPKSDSILPSITRRSLIYVAKEYLGLEAEERESLLRRSERFRRVRSLRYCCRYLSSWKDQRPRQRNLLPKRNGENGTSYPEAVRHTDRHPDGTHRGSGRMDQSNRVIQQIFGFIQHRKTGCTFLTWPAIFAYTFLLLSFLSYFTKVYSRSK